MIQSVNHFALLPGYVAAGTAILVLLIDLVSARRGAVLGAAVVGAAGAGVAAVVVAARVAADAAEGSAAAGTFCNGRPPVGPGLAPPDCSWVADPLAALVAVLFAVLTVGVLLLSAPGLRAGTAPAGEFCFLLTCSLTGGVTIGYAGDLITLIVGLETLTLPLYVLVGLRRFAPRERVTVHGADAAVTFFVVSVVSTAVALLGAALVYASTGLLHLDLLALAGDGGPAGAGLGSPNGPYAALESVGVALIVIGFAFKVAAVPLHAWAPATYDGAPLPVAAYLSTASKLGGVVALAVVAFSLPSPVDVGVLIAALAVLTMTVGNLVALRQRRMVRLLAWSSVAQAGYILAPLAAVGGAGFGAINAAVGYAAFFVVLEFVAFGVLVALRPAGADGGTIADYRGAGRRSPWLGAAMVLALAGLAGLPPGLAGLFAKVTIVQELIGADWGWLAGVVALNAVIGLAYYVRVAAILYADPESTDRGVATASRVPWPVVAALAGAAALAIVLGFAPQLVLDVASR